MVFHYARANELAQGTPERWRASLRELPASHVYALGNELARMIEHSLATPALAPWRQTAGMRLGDILGECDERWRKIRNHPSNDDISDTLYNIYVSCA